MPRPSAKTLHQILQSTSDTLFPAELGRKTVSLDSTDANGDTPLHVLLWRRDRAGALLLIEHGAKINAVGDMGETPLHLALRRGDADLVAVLLAAGARTDIVSEFGQTPAELARQRGIRLAALRKPWAP